jgi:hypothetical protein
MRRWLEHDLTFWSRHSRGAGAKVRAEVGQRLAGWQGDFWLVEVRSSAALAKLPPSERHPWFMIWAELAALRKKAEEIPK